MPMYKDSLRIQQLRLNPINKIIDLFKCCPLCQIDPIQHHGACKDCFARLPWFKQKVTRHELDIWAACRYEFPLDHVLQQFKYHQGLSYRRLLTACLLQHPKPRVDAIIAMPMSATRLAERGYNQALLLARDLAAAYQLPLWQPIIRQHRVQQKMLDRSERLNNLATAFEIQEPVKKRYKRVLVVDDVVTTGSSLHYLQLQLQELGCEQILFHCVAAAK